MREGPFMNGSMNGSLAAAATIHTMFEQAFKNIDDVLWKEAGCTTELDYTEQTSWLLFLKYLDDLEEDKSTEAELDGKKYTYILEKPYRWESWAAPKDKGGKLDHNKASERDRMVARNATTLNDAPACRLQCGVNMQGACVVF